MSGAPADKVAGKAGCYLPQWEEWRPPRPAHPRAEGRHNAPPVTMYSRHDSSPVPRRGVLERPGGLNLVRSDRRPPGWTPENPRGTPAPEPIDPARLQEGLARVATRSVFPIFRAYRRAAECGVDTGPWQELWSAANRRERAAHALATEARDAK